MKSNSGDGIISKNMNHAATTIMIFLLLLLLLVLPGVAWTKGRIAETGQ